MATTSRRVESLRAVALAHADERIHRARGARGTPQPAEGLLAIAMGLFTGSTMSEAIELPKLLLLDEADASLHPSMVRSLLTVIEEVFVGKYGVRVILATHSPSTVALAPESALYVMSRTGKRLAKTTTDQAMKSLTVGISSLSVRLDNRRQIFVESEYDQIIFQELFALLKGNVANERSAEFIAAGRRDVGGGCDRVKALVKDLRAAGSTTVSGIIDRDDRVGAPEHIYFMEDRYSIENLVFDPLILATFLLREQIMTAEELGIPARTRSHELGPPHAGPLISAIACRMGIDPTEQRRVEYLGKFAQDVPAAFLETRGHDLENQIVEVFPQLRALKQDLKRQIVKRAVGDVPQFVPVSFMALLQRVLDD